jgi:hypothetical protein
MANRNLAIIVGVIAAGALVGMFVVSPKKAGLPGSGTQAAGAKGSDPNSNGGARNSAVPGSTDGKLDLASGLEVVEKASDDIQRNDLIEELVAGIPIEKTTEALDFLLTKEGTASNRELQLRLLRRLAEKAPKAAAEYANQKLSGKNRQDVLNNIATVWAESDSTEAIAWARALPDEDRNLLFVGIAYSMVENEPLKALELARELPATESRDELVSHIAQNWSTKDAAKASEWAQQIPDVQLRERIVKGIAAAWGETDPAAAANLALTALQPGRNQDDAVMGIVQRWVQNKPVDAAEWVVKFPEGNLRQTAMAELVKLWADNDAEEAGDWINTLPPGESRDRALSAYVGKIASEKPDVAAQWAGRIADEGQRFLYLERIGQVWLTTDQAAARTWISKSGLPDSTKERLLGSKVP